MPSFTYYAPTKVVFGRDAENDTGKLVREFGGKNVLVIFGGESAKKSGLLDRISYCLSAEGIRFTQIGGVVPNPRLSKVYECIDVCREENIDFILSVGGGSVIDTAKATAYGVPYAGDVWDFYCGKAVPKKAMPMGCVLTIAAAGSEMSNSSVITNEDGWLKRGYKNDLSRQRFAVMNPELTYTLPPAQTANGIIDIMMHTMERYFSRERDLFVTDEIAEGLLRSVMRSAFTLKYEPANYDARASLMWASSLSHNGLTGCGLCEDWATHQIEHELSGMFDCAHAPGLSAVWGSWARYVMDADYSRFAQFARQVMEVGGENDDREAAELGIAAFEDFCRSIDMPTNIRELGYKLTDSQIDELAEKCTFFGTRTVGAFKKLNCDDIAAIYRAARG
ncbi:MAG: iron-containing alcohol dehydrogenase [Synergistes sp.]|nr:iron-containing alcohol dehydrogenase [Synergistes sp.]